MDSRDPEQIGKLILRLHNRFPDLTLHEVYDMAYEGLLEENGFDDIESNGDRSWDHDRIRTRCDSQRTDALHDISENGRG